MHDSKKTKQQLIDELTSCRNQLEAIKADSDATHADLRDLEKGHDFLELREQQRTSELIEINKTLRQEIKARLQTEVRLRRAIKRAELVYKVSPCAIFNVDTNRNITAWNNKTEEISGYSHDEIYGRKCNIFCNSAEACGLFAKGATPPIVNRECVMRTKDGRELAILKSADLLRDSDGNIIGGIESFEDITQRKHMDKLLRSERDKFHGIISATKQGIHIVNPNYEIEFQNDVLKKIFGNKIGHKCYEVYKNRSEPCEICRMHRVIETNQIEHTSDILIGARHYSQSYAPFTDVDGQTKCLVLLQDITVEKLNQAKALRAAQLASVGELAAGVAHEINNPINGIINYAQILLDDSEGDEVHERLLSRVIKEGERVADIVSKLLAFSRQHEDEEVLHDDVHIEKVLNDAFALFKHQFHKNGISTTISIPAHIPPLRIHPHQLQQVFVNLLSNAGYALNNRYHATDPKKRLEIVVSLVELSGKDFIRISFTDYGFGIPQDIIDEIFNPFFSTKEQGEGTGLGLSISQGLIQSFHGDIHIKSQYGTYTEVTIDLPVSPKQQQNTSSITPSAQE